MIMAVLRLGLPVGSWPGVTVRVMSYPLTAAQANLAELVAEARADHAFVVRSAGSRAAGHERVVALSHGSLGVAVTPG
jgi:hypothetical protein